MKGNEDDLRWRSGLGNVFNVVQHRGSGALFNCSWPKALGIREGRVLSLGE